MEEVKAGDFKKSWIAVGADGVTPHNAATAHVYRGVNSILLSFAALKFDYKLGRWMTFLQAKDLGGSVKGQKSRTIVNYGHSFRDKNNNKINEETYKRLLKAGAEPKAIPYLKKISVFNVAQIEGLPSKYYKTKKIENLQGFNALEEPEYILNNCGAQIEEKPQDRAFYAPALDRIVLPLREQFKGSAENFYSVAFHEIGHWTGHSSRCDRNLEGSFGSPKYAFEELVAEMSASFLCAVCGLDFDMKNSASYIDSWIKGLKDDKKAFIKAAKLAQNASDYIIEQCKDGLSVAA